MAITAGGIGSGLDIEGLVSQLVAAEGAPATFRLDNKEARLQSDFSAMGALKGALSAFQASVGGLKDEADFQARKTSVSNSDFFTASADNTAVAGSYDIEVFQLAEAAKMRSGDFTSETEVVGTGTLDISLGAETFQITVDNSNQTLAGIRDAINAATDNPGITASIINVDSGSQLVFTSDKIGAANTIDVAAFDDDVLDGFDLTRLATVNLISIQPAQDAIIYVDAQKVTRDSNSFSDIISGVTFNLKQEEVGTIETLTVELNKDSVKSKVNSFVSAYNSLADTMNSLSAFDADTGAKGALLGDSLLRGVQSQLRQTMTNAISGLEFGTLSEIGVTTDDKGHLVVDSADLDKVLDSDFTAVSQLFASENGLANSLDTLLDRYVASDGVMSSRTDSIKTSIDSIGDDRVQLNKRLASLEARYRAQFTAMDMLVGQLQSTGSFLSAQLANLPKPNSINSN